MYFEEQDYPSKVVGRFLGFVTWALVDNPFGTGIANTDFPDR